jgi:hypothetical protein
MSDNPRDTQFAGYAKLLLKKLFAGEDIWIDTITPDWEAKWERIIAQGAYDLASHILSHTTEAMVAECELPSCIPECVESLPDLTAWPEQQHEEGGTA